jgi:type IV secretory pathway VirB4 component
MNPETRFSGQWICAAQGTGKSNMLLHMLARDLKRDAAIIIIDPKGDVSGPIRNLDLQDRLVILDPRQPFAINPLDVPKDDVRKAVNNLEYIFGVLLDASVTPMQKSLLRSILRAVVTAFPEPTLHTIWELIIRGPAQFREYIDRLPDDLREVFTTEWKSYDRTRSELKWRMRLLLENDLIRKMFGAPKTRFKIGEAMDRGDVVVIDNSIEKLETDGSAFLGRFFLAQIWGAAMARSSRPQSKKKPVFVYIDEADLIIGNDPIIAQIIDRCRSQNIALILAHQRAAQIEEKNVLSALENCAIKMANVDAEAAYFSKLLHIPEEKMNQLPRGHFAMHVRGEGSSIQQVPKAQLPFPIMYDWMKQHVMERMQRLYGIKKEPPPEPDIPPAQPKPKTPSGSPETHKPPQSDGLLNSSDVEIHKPILPRKDPSAPSARRRPQ